jgi:serine O-acetyltransferase
VPARAVRVGNQKVASAHADLDQIHIPDPVAIELCKLLKRLETREKELAEERKEAKT